MLKVKTISAPKDEYFKWLLKSQGSHSSKLILNKFSISFHEAMCIKYNITYNI